MRPSDEGAGQSMLGMACRLSGACHAELRKACVLLHDIRREGACKRCVLRLRPTNQMSLATGWTSKECVASILNSFCRLAAWRVWSTLGFCRLTASDSQLNLEDEDLPWQDEESESSFLCPCMCQNHWLLTGRWPTPASDISWRRGRASHDVVSSTRDSCKHKPRCELAPACARRPSACLARATQTDAAQTCGRQAGLVRKLRSGLCRQGRMTM